MPVDPTSILVAPANLDYGCYSYPSVAWGSGAAFLVAACGQADRITPGVRGWDPLPSRICATLSTGTVPCVPDAKWPIVEATMVPRGATTVMRGRSSRSGWALQLLIVVALGMSAAPPTGADPGVEPLVVGPRQDLSEPVYVPHEGHEPSVASNGDLSLAVWWSTDQGAFAQRIGLDGTPMDPSSIFLPSIPCEPAVAWGGGVFLVASCGQARRITPEGEVLAVDPFFAPEPALSTVAWDGSVFLVAWERSDDIYGIRLGPDGSVLDPDPFPIVVAEGNKRDLRVASLGDGFLLVWKDERLGSGDIYAARVTSEGSVLDPSGYVVSAAPGEQDAPAVAPNGAGFLAAWTDRRDGRSDVYAARIAGDGTVLDPAAFPVAATEHADTAEAVASDGIDFAVLIETGPGQSRTPRALIVTGDGDVTDPGGDLPGFGDPDLAWNGTSYQIAYADCHPSFYCPPQTVIGGALLTPQGALDGGEHLLSLAANAQTGPVVAWDGSTYLAAWRDGRVAPASVGDYFNRHFDLYVARIAPDGASLDGPGILVSGSVRAISRLSVAAGGGVFLVVWYEPSDYYTQARILAARVTSDGDLLDATPLVVRGPFADLANDLDVTWSGTGFVVVWAEGSGRNGIEVFAARVTAGGQLPDGRGVQVTDEIGAQTQVSVASAGSGGILAVWQDTRNGQSDIYGARLREDRRRLVVRDPDGFAISVKKPDQIEPDVEAGNGMYLVAWEQDQDVVASRVSAMGQPLDGAPIPIGVGQEDQQRAAVVWDGANFVVAWKSAPRQDASLLTVQARRVSRAGELLDPEGVVVDGPRQVEDFSDPATAGGPAGQAAVAYTLIDAALTRSANERSVMRFLREPDPFDLAIDLEDDPDPVVVGQELTYTLSIRNQTFLPTTRVIVTDALSTDVAFISATPSQGRCAGEVIVRCNLGTLGPGALATIEIVVRASPAPDRSEITNTASVRADQLDPDPLDNTATESTLILPDVGCTRWGTPGDDELIGTTDGDDIICGLAGNDHINGRGGNDLIHGGYGDDTIDGSIGADELHGNPGDDTLLGSGGNDSLFGERGFDDLDGGSGTDTCDIGPEGGTIVRCE